MMAHILKQKSVSSTPDLAVGELYTGKGTESVKIQTYVLGKYKLIIKINSSGFTKSTQLLVKMTVL